MKKILVLLFLFKICLFSQNIPAPEQIIGFKPGEDKKLADWKQITEYFKLIDQKSDRVVLEELGKTTKGRSFIMAIISSEENIKNLDKIKDIQKNIAQPYFLPESQAKELTKKGKTILLITMNIHSTEIASSQQSMELLYELASLNTEKIKNILENVIILMVPSLNPDGLDLVVDWYKKTLGTPSEGTSPVELYHSYAGHDNNRDFFMYNLSESKLIAKVLYHDWFPEIILDQHQMGNSGPRMFIPPYDDPVNPNINTIVNSETNLLGEFMINDMQKSGLKGVVNGTVFNGYFPGTMSKTPAWHNRIGILTEAASVLIATPLYFPKGSITGMGQNLPENKMQVNNLSPFEEGWWRLRDIINYEKISAYSVMEFAAILKEKVKNNFYKMNADAIERGKTEAPFGYIIPTEQHDPNAAVEMLKRLKISGVVVRQLTKPLEIENRIYPEGSFYVSLSQPSRSYILDLFSVQRYPNLKQYPGGPPKRPYDVTGWTLPFQMGVEFATLEKNVPINSEIIEKPELKIQNITKNDLYIIERRYTNSYGFIFSLFKQGIEVFEARNSFSSEKNNFSTGDFIIPKVDIKLIRKLSEEWNIPVVSVRNDGNIIMQKISAARVAVYQPWTPDEDEGWTRLILDKFNIEYKSLHNEDFKKQDFPLNKDFDVIIFPDMSALNIFEGRESDKWSEEPGIGQPQKPKEYLGGIGKEGVNAVKKFLADGGTVLCLGEASDFAIEHLKVPAINILKKTPSSEFYAPGSIFEINLDLNNPLTFGMKEKANIYFNNNPAFILKPSVTMSKIIGYYGETNPLKSGWLIGWENLAGKTAMAEIPYNKGRVIMYGFRVQNRAQTYGTFKLFLNSLFR